MYEKSPYSFTNDELVKAVTDAVTILAFATADHKPIEELNVLRDNMYYILSVLLARLDGVTPNFGYGEGDCVEPVKIDALTPSGTRVVERVYYRGTGCGFHIHFLDDGGVHKTNHMPSSYRRPGKSISESQC